MLLLVFLITVTVSNSVCVYRMKMYSLVDCNLEII